MPRRARGLRPLCLCVFSSSIVWQPGGSKWERGRSSLPAHTRSFRRLSQTCFCFEWGDLWLSTVVIFGLLWTLIVLYRYVKLPHTSLPVLVSPQSPSLTLAFLPPSESITPSPLHSLASLLLHLLLSTFFFLPFVLLPPLSVFSRIGFASDPTPGAPTSSYLEFWILRVPVSLYLGWVTVASILNVAVAATPKNGVASWGWTPSDWGIVMMTIAAVIALTAVARHWDGVFGGVVTWALVAIGKKQGTPGNPGDDRVVVTAFVLAGIVGTAAFLAVAQRLRLWYLRRGTPEGANNPQHLVISVEKEADPQLLQDTHDSPVDWK